MRRRRKELLRKKEAKQQELMVSLLNHFRSTVESRVKDVQRRVDRKEFPRVVEVAGRVYDSRNYLPMDPSSKESFKKYLARCMRRTTQLRNQDSAVGACDGREA